MTLLLDTHVFLWWRLDSRRLTRPVRNAIATADVVWVSAASAWEVAIKQHLGKIQLEDSFASMVEGSDFHPLPITLAHADRTADLPPHHMDPFDRMLIAQAITEGATFVTHDRGCEPYDVPILWT
ncbi:MAG: hypothetical protein A3H96_05255 [Acidobacteria bacterium RIFCSPLOWO2_02_FULL_67_36]|nr:MAG: hypothetical protein A3H96_05255 [Acidobacteria bacterium RIFCSPLOWO2_02_FULL_67_36]OFW21650.1 MAG: hypothetical protein A3G21_14735 [Acidobacteria bacterium RIFCSPLOWO2_12_FULL_66_21]